MSTELTALEAEIVLKTTVHGRPTEKVSKSFLSEKPDIAAVLIAIEARNDVVYLPTFGKKFTMRVYLGNRRLFIKPVDAFVPCGWFNY